MEIEIIRQGKGAWEKWTNQGEQLVFKMPICKLRRFSSCSVTSGRRRRHMHEQQKLPALLLQSVSRSVKGGMGVVSQSTYQGVQNCPL